jgi:hypothetical protein
MQWSASRKRSGHFLLNHADDLRGDVDAVAVGG